MFSKNGKTLTPLLTQLIRSKDTVVIDRLKITKEQSYLESRLESRRSTLVPLSSNNVNIPISHDISIPRKHERVSMHLLPLSSNRQPLAIVDTTFVIKPEETMIDGEMNDETTDEPNGTYRAPKTHYRSRLPVFQFENSLLHTHPNIPARLCFSPTILHEADSSSESSTDEASPTCPPAQRRNDQLTVQHRPSNESPSLFVR